ncbi:MAG: LysM peptidoglycan-binding domain-containing protein [Verrucomicrobiota bacterium]|nr:LysM peptidoglycan-binding domain-containing protein [Limisphaera sp.]MDW8382282.1 LysM peptidoglycan-binding domain-containing protein [Verrucomicrobiota bacterium]
MPLLTRPAVVGKQYTYHVYIGISTRRKAEADPSRGLRRSIVSPIVRLMSQWRYFGITMLLGAVVAGAGQDAALEERLNRMEGHIRDLLTAQADLQKRINTLVRELDELREQIRAGNGDRATQADLRRLSEAVQEVDRKRREDFEKIRQEIQHLAKVLVQPAPPSRTSTRGLEERPSVIRSASGTKTSTVAQSAEVGYEYVVKPGDTLHAILQAYREQGIQVSLTQVLQANPGLNPNRLQVGQKIFIPAPQP